METYCLRVKRQSAGKVFPFDRVYISINGEHHIFKDMFRYALVLPVEENLMNLLLDHVEIEAGETHGFNRNDDAPAPTNEEWKVFLETNECVMAVPILSKYLASNLPRYLTAAGKYRHPVEGQKPSRARRSNPRHQLAQVKSPFPALTYLQTPGQNIRPVCVACPRFLLHQNGHCSLGDEVCYTSLAMGLDNHFREGMQAPVGENMLMEEGV